jgi:hypothetical protein
LGKPDPSTTAEKERARERGTDVKREATPFLIGSFSHVTWGDTVFLEYESSASQEAPPQVPYEKEEDYATIREREWVDDAVCQRYFSRIFEGSRTSTKSVISFFLSVETNRI